MNYLKSSPAPVYRSVTSHQCFSSYGHLFQLRNLGLSTILASTRDTTAQGAGPWTSEAPQAPWIII